ncbi:MAG: hypothetical protein JNL21_03490 [Myxococcales bacterium]|nr:hypothetical protein [Myxococcales bacterium]
MKLPTSILMLSLLVGSSACSGTAPAPASSGRADAGAAPASATSTLATDAPALAGPTSRGDLAAWDRLPAPTRRAIDAADLVVTATLSGSKIASVLEVAPPIFVHEFDVVVSERLGGAAVTGPIHAVWETLERETAWSDGVPMVIALRKIEATLPAQGVQWDVTFIAPSTSDLVLGVRAARRPADPSLGISIAQVPADRHVQWDNDYGDGLFDLTITNRGGSPVEVPGLREVDGRVLWDEAIVVRDVAERTLHLGAASPRPAKAVVLAPGATLTKRVDVKPLGIVLPVGGGRQHYSFAIGELRVTSFFYYTHGLHGPQMGPVR